MKTSVYYHSQNRRTQKW